MAKRMVLMLVAVALVLGGIFGFKAYMGMMMGKMMAGMGGQAQVISASKAGYQDWQPQIKAVGSLRAVNGTNLSSETAGIVQTISFESGADVEKEVVLIQLRAEDDIAKLHALEASAKLAEINWQRDTRQLKAQAISQAAADNDAAVLEGAKAQVAEQQAVLNKKTIHAPFAGRLGVRMVDVGQYLNPGAPIVTLQQLDPIYVDFTVPEQALAQIRTGHKIIAMVDARPGTSFEGEISAINSKVDEETRNVQVRGTFRNADHKLQPGMFASVTIEAGAAAHHITLPQTVITYNPYGDTVFVVDGTDPSKPVAKQVFVTTGPTRGDQVAILKGIKEGDMVVTTGQIKLRNGAAITINNEIQPSNDADPKPEDR